MSRVINVHDPAIEWREKQSFGDMPSYMQRLVARVGTWEDYQEAQGSLVRDHIAGRCTDELHALRVEDRQLLWKQSRHYDGRD